MHKATLGIVSLLISYNIHAADPLKPIHIDERSKNRTICHLEFASVNGLSVDAIPTDIDVYHSRVNNERYAACPYDLKIGYGGLSMRVDFGTSFDLESVIKYRHSSPVDSGFFIYDGENWRAQADTLSASDAELQLVKGNDSQLVSGLLRRVDQKLKAKDYCYAFTLVYDTGYATGGVCAAREEGLRPWRALFLRESIIHYKP